MEKTLTVNDQLVLDSIINPLMPFLESNPGMGPLRFEPVVEKDDDDDDDDDKKWKGMESEAIKVAEQGRLDEALNLLNKACEVAPTSSSVYNNRAQTHRLMGNVDLAMKDLNRSLELSGEQGGSASQAFCQRGLIYQKMNLESLAKEDFEKAAKMGSQFAKAILIEMNPYAAMCNRMLKNVFSAMTNSKPTQN